MATHVRFKLSKEAAAALLTSDGVQSEMDRRAKLILNRQRSLGPVDTGNLRDHLEIRKRKNGRSRAVGAFGVDYGAAVEEGHETSSGTWVPAQPYIRPSIDAAKD